MGNKKLVCAIIIVILLIVAIIAGYLHVQNGTKQAAVLQDEMTKIAESDLTENEIDMNIKSSGKYAVVEEAVKNYLNDVRNMYLEVSSYGSDDQISKILSPENIQQDEKDLTAVKQKVDEYGQKLDELKDKNANITNEDTIMNAINSKNLKQNYVDVYRNIMFNEAVQSNLTSVQSKINDQIDTAWEKVDNLEDVVDYLKDNENYWEIEDGKIQFTNVNKLTQYYQLLNKSNASNE